MLVRRETRTGSNDLNVLYRPLKVDEMLGQEANCNMVQKWLGEDTTPHTLLFTGEPGCGKTTMSRIVALGLNCKDTPGSEPCFKCDSCLGVINQNSIDVMEINVGTHGTKGDVTNIVKDLPGAPFNSRYKVVIFDEAQELTSASQNLLLKIMEDGYRHVYMIFCTNEPEKLKPAFRGGRVTRLHFDKLSDKMLYDLLVNVAEFEGMKYDSKILLYLAEESKGVPRDCLPWLKQVNDEGSWSLGAAKAIVGILLDKDDPDIIKLCTTLYNGDWTKAKNMYSNIKMPAESKRAAMCGFFVYRVKTVRKLGEARLYNDLAKLIVDPIYLPGKLGDHKMLTAMFDMVSLVKERKRIK